MRVGNFIGVMVLLAGMNMAPLQAEEPDHGLGVSAQAPRSMDEYRSWTSADKERIYEALIADPVYQEMMRQPFPKGRTLDVSTGIFDEGLRYLPLSPLEIQEIESRRRAIDLPIPSFLLEEHRRWFELHFPDQKIEPASSTGKNGERGAKSAAGVSISENLNLGHNDPFPPIANENEVQIVVDPSDPAKIAASSNSGGSSEGNSYAGWPPMRVFYSGDGGESWDMSFAPKGDAFGLTEPIRGCDQYGGCDPAIMWDDQGKLYLQYMALCIHCHLLMCSTLDSEASMVMAASNDGGATWSPLGVVRDGWKEDGNRDLNDKNFMEIDTSPVDLETGEVNPNYGNQYVCWDRANDEKVAWSTDGGVSWTEVDLPDVPGKEIGCDMATGDDGIVHIIYQGLGSDYGFQDSYYSRSTDGGKTWSNPVSLVREHLVPFSEGSRIEAQDQRGISNEAILDIDNSGGKCDGMLYAVYTDAPSIDRQEEADIYLIRSADNGLSWSEPLKVNDDETLHTQFHPYLDVDQVTGDLIVGWQDTRNATSGRKIDIYIARSTDCGKSFEANIPMTAPSEDFRNGAASWSDFNSEDNPLAGNMQTGEYFGLDTLNGKVWAAWSDSREFYPVAEEDSQLSNIGFAVLTFSPDSAEAIFTDGFESGDLSAWK